MLKQTQYFIDAIDLAVGKGNVIWAGSLNQGVYRFKVHQNGSFTKAPMLTNHAIRQMVTDSEGRLYIGQYGSSGAQAINGGVDMIKDSSFNFTYIDALDAQPNKLKNTLCSLYLLQ